MNLPQTLAQWGLPALALLCTWSAHLAARWLLNRGSAALRRNLPPLLLSLLITAAVVWGTGLPWEEYQRGTRVLIWLLAPATVALAIPLANSPGLTRQLGRVTLAVAAGCVFNLALTLLVCRLLGVENPLAASLQPRTTTAAIALEIGKRNGGDAALAAGFSVLCGLMGSWLYPLLWRTGQGQASNKNSGGASAASIGLAVGTAAHGIGTSRLAAEESAPQAVLHAERETREPEPGPQAEEVSATAAGAFAMAIAGLITALLNLPWMWGGR